MITQLITDIKLKVAKIFDFPFVTQVNSLRKKEKTRSRRLLVAKRPFKEDDNWVGESIHFTGPVVWS